MEDIIVLKAKLMSAFCAAITNTIPLGLAVVISICPLRLLRIILGIIVNHSSSRRWLHMFLVEIKFRISLWNLMYDIFILILNAINY
jgi:hypothetical protein